MWRILYIKKRVNEILKEEAGVGVVEVILILVGIFTPYYRMSIRCIKWKHVDKQD